ncbi:hypothetical protein WICMUC_003317 [Wickerhamomyces mucosus]|uniref:SANT domain-containing protein n=1 Tax=Wickerhamomyces mucosus TaxID=1378264 RepID=A0A9P8TD91_9ASCO|nr:hypothetical protein WICMUC_003317 [Wickerhamomyces mucosus]
MMFAIPSSKGLVKDVDNLNQLQYTYYHNNQSAIAFKLAFLATVVYGSFKIITPSSISQNLRYDLTSQSLSIALLVLGFILSNSITVNKTESVTTFSHLGIQITQTSGLLYKSLNLHRFIPAKDIVEIVINEGFKGLQVVYYLAIILKDHDKLIIILPRSDKSGVRFTPKVRQRRSITSTPTAESRATSVTPSAVEISEIVITDNKLHDKDQYEKDDGNDNDSNDNENDNETNNEDNDTSNLPVAPNHTVSSRRSSTIDYTETRQKKSLALSNTQKPSDVFKKQDNSKKPPLNSQIFTERRQSISSTVISIPQPSASQTKPKRKSSVSAKGRRRSSTVDPGTIVVSNPSSIFPTPDSTQKTATIEENENTNKVATIQSKAEADAEADAKEQAKVEAKEQSKVEAKEKAETEAETAGETKIEAKTKSKTKVKAKPKTKPQTRAKIKAPQTEDEKEKIDSKTKVNPSVTKSLTVSSTDNKNDSNKEKIEGFILDEVSKKLRKVFYDETEKDTLDIKTEFKVTTYDQFSKSFSKLDPELSQSVSLDEEKFKMEDLCRPTLPIGKVSSNFKFAQEAKKSKMLQRLENKKLRQKAKMEKRSLESYLDDDSKKEIKKIKKEELFDYNEESSSQSQAIQLKVGADGNIVVDEESRIVDRHSNIESLSRERHNQNPFENIVNSATYGKRSYTDKWDEEEVFKLYKALSQWGTDFALIAQMFPHRTRKQVKAKFILEEKKRPRLIELALSNKLNITFDFDKYCQDSNKSFATLNEFNVKLENLKQEHEENMKELTIAKEKAKEEDLARQKQREIEIRNQNSGGASRNLSRQERLIELRKNETVIGSIDDVKKQIPLE